VITCIGPISLLVLPIKLH